MGDIPMLRITRVSQTREEVVLTVEGWAYVEEQFLNRGGTNTSVEQIAQEEIIFADEMEE